MLVEGMRSFPNPSRHTKYIDRSSEYINERVIDEHAIVSNQIHNSSMSGNAERVVLYARASSNVSEDQDLNGD